MKTHRRIIRRYANYWLIEKDRCMGRPVYDVLRRRPLEWGSTVKTFRHKRAAIGWCRRNLSLTDEA